MHYWQLGQYLPTIPMIDSYRFVLIIWFHFTFGADLSTVESPHPPLALRRGLQAPPPLATLFEPVPKGGLHGLDLPSLLTPVVHELPGSLLKVNVCKHGLHLLNPLVFNLEVLEFL